MSAIYLSEPHLAALKKALRSEFPGTKSSHLSEALAAALGRRTHAALLADLKACHEDPPVELLDYDKFAERLEQLGYTRDPDFDFELMDIPELILTTPISAYDIDYKTHRQKAWRNLMVSTINEGLQRKLFSLKAGDNRWPGAAASENGRPEGCLFDFTLPNGLTARAYVHDAGFDELTIHVAVNPKGDMVKAAFAGFSAGDAFASGWLERRDGAWLQTSTHSFNCRKNLLLDLAAFQIRASGFGDRGRVIN